MTPPEGGFDPADADADQVGGWTCPHCGRLFDQRGRTHECAPGLALEEYLAGGPAHERPVVEAVLDHLGSLGPLHTDVVSVGIFCKNPRKFAELRPRRRWVAIAFALDHRASHPTITRKVIEAGGRFWHVANVAHPGQLDADLLDLLAESYDTAAEV